MTEFLKNNIFPVLLLVLICLLSFTQVLRAQEKLPKNFNYESFSLQEQAPQDFLDCQSMKYYDNISYFWATPSSATTFTVFAQYFAQVRGKKLSTVNLFIYNSFDSFSDSSGQGIDLIFYNSSFYGLPTDEILSITVPSVDLKYFPDTTIIDVSAYDLHFSSNYFYIGFSVANQSVDTMAFLTDDGNNSYASVAYGYGDKDGDGDSSWYNFRDFYGENYNFMVEAVYCFNPKTIRVPEDYLTISEAIDSSMGYDTILVNDGIYSGLDNINLEVINKSLYFKSVNGPEFTKLDGTNYPGSGIIFKKTSGQSSFIPGEIDGFTFIHLTGAIVGEYTHMLTIKNCVFYRNHEYSSNPASYNRGVISCGGVDLLIENCTISSNLATKGMITIIGGNPTIRNTIITNYQTGTAFITFPGASVYPNFTIENTNLYSSHIDSEDWTDNISHLEHINGNISEDPLFCVDTAWDFHINEMSFCNATHPLNSTGVLIGALGVNCTGCDDADSDGICDVNDNCPTTYNPLQTDSDLDGIGEECDACPLDAENDTDGDGYCGDVDNCPTTYNPSQSDIDNDTFGDDCDNCPSKYNLAQSDVDLDGIGDSCDVCTDTDNDGYGNPGFPSNTCPDDNCSLIYNPNQIDSDGDGVGDACDGCYDTDGDGYGNPAYMNSLCEDDNCPDIYNPDQADSNLDGIGDACCCIGIRGNTNADPAEQIDISDLVAMVAYMFIADIPQCPNEINVNGDVNIDISDLVFMVAYMFQGGPPPENCQ